MKEKIIIHENEDCDAEYFLCSWFDIDKIPKHKMILSAEEIVKMMEAYHNQKPNTTIAEAMPTEEEIDDTVRQFAPFEAVKSTNTYGEDYNTPKRYGFRMGARWFSNRMKGKEK